MLKIVIVDKHTVVWLPQKLELLTLANNSSFWGNLLIVWVYLHSNFSGGLCKTHSAYRTFKSSNVIHFGTNRKRVCDFLLVRHSNLDPIMLHFRDTADFLLTNSPSPYSTQIFGIFLLDQIADAGAPRSKDPRLIGCKIIFEVFHQTTWSETWTSQRDGRTTWRGITALCVALCGKN